MEEEHINVENEYINTGEEHAKTENEHVKVKELHSPSTEPLWVYEGTREASFIDPPMSDCSLCV